MANNPETSNCSKKIDIRYNFIRHCSITHYFQNCQIQAVYPHENEAGLVSRPINPTELIDWAIANIQKYTHIGQIQ